MESKEMKMYDGKVYGVKVSDYGIENGYLDYLTLSKIIGDCIFNNTIRRNKLGLCLDRCQTHLKGGMHYGNVCID